MNVRHRILQAACACIAGLAAGAVLAAAHDYSDNWWSPDEDGSGVSVQQQADVLFINLFVYGADGAPVWFTAAAPRVSNAVIGHDVFSGDLYQTTGPYYGTAWDASLVQYRKVGTVTFGAASVDAATLTYIIDGARFAKNLSRVPMAYEDLSGHYYIGWNADCQGIWRIYFDTQIVMTVYHDDMVTMQMFRTDIADREGVAFSGTYSQSGHVGQIVAQMTRGGSGSATFYDIESTAYGFTARITGTLTAQGVECRMANGRIGGVRVGP